MAFRRTIPRRRGRSEREARGRLLRRVTFVVAAVGLIFGVHYAVDDFTRFDDDIAADKAGVFGNPSDVPAATAGAGFAPPPGLAGAPPGPNSGPSPAGPAGAAMPLPPGMDPAMRAKASEMQKRYSDRLSKMSTQDKIRALNKASKLLGRDVRGMIGR